MKWFSPLTAAESVAVGAGLLTSGVRGIVTSDGVEETIQGGESKAT